MTELIEPGILIEPENPKSKSDVLKTVNSKSLNIPVQKIAPKISGRDSLEVLSNGEGVKLGTSRKLRKPRDKKIYDAALVATLCGQHVEKAVKTIVALMTHSRRENIKLKAATTLIELALERDVSASAVTTNKTYVLVNAPQTIAAAAEEARKRRLAAIETTGESVESKEGV